MKNKFTDLIDQTYYFPQDGFDLRNGYLHFHGVNIKHLIEEHDTPFKVIYLPKIGGQIKRAKNWFKKSIKKNGYRGKYYYCYCTKCCHFHHVISEALAHDTHLETSSSFDIDLILKLYEEGKVTKSHILVHNGYKTADYLQKIVLLNRKGFKNSIAVLDNMRELEQLNKMTRKSLKIGIRVATDLQPQSDYYTSRLGIRSSEIISFYQHQIAPNYALYGYT